MKKFFIALQFLTIIPVHISGKIDERDLGRSLLYFPVVGFLLGTFLASAAFTLIPLPSLVRSVLILILWIIITGAIHLDGLADTCDGFYGGRTREETLRIMRDSRIGTMGVVGIAVVLLAKFTLIASLSAPYLWKTLIMAATFSRWSQALSCLISGYARHEGKAKLFIAYAQRNDIILGGLFTLALFMLFSGLKGVLLFVIALLAGLLFVRYAKIKIGGMTGDVIGALNEATETIVLFSAPIIFGYV